jgi:uncharacterized Zn ribbon protein
MNKFTIVNSDLYVKKSDIPTLKKGGEVKAYKIVNDISTIRE